MPQLEGETLEAWLARISDEYVAASAIDEELHRSGGFDRPVAPGEPYPVITDELTAAGERVLVLEHQMAEVRQSLRRQMGD